jgi:hypothetical protein
MLKLESTVTQLSLRFTEFANLAYTPDSTRTTVASQSGSSIPSDFLMRDCELYTCYFSVSHGGSGTPTPTVKNTLFHRSYLSIANTASNPVGMETRNNHFRYSTFSIGNVYNFNSWIVKENLFDNATISTYNSSITSGNNGYISTTALSGDGSSAKTVSSGDFQAGVLGAWYYPTVGGNLSTLIDAGSQTSGNAALYHYTVRTDHTKDSANVDIGRHYVALDSSGIPTDYDGDSLFDFLEDRNGDGSASGDSTSWQSYNSAGALAGATGLEVFTPLK